MNLKLPGRDPALVALLILASMVATPVCAATTRTVQVNADGTFTPKYVFIRDGDTVEWRLSNPTTCSDRCNDTAWNIERSIGPPVRRIA